MAFTSLTWVCAGVITAFVDFALSKLKTCLPARFLFFSFWLFYFGSALSNVDFGAGVAVSSPYIAADVKVTLVVTVVEVSSGLCNDGAWISGEHYCRWRILTTDHLKAFTIVADAVPGVGQIRADGGCR